MDAAGTDNDPAAAAPPPPPSPSDPPPSAPQDPAPAEAATPSPPVEAPATPLKARRVHQPFLARLRLAGHDEAGFHAPQVGTWFRIGVAAVAILALLPFITPQWTHTTERLATLASLVFLVAAIGLWLGLGGRSFLVAATLVGLLYGATAWTPYAFPLADFFVVAVVASFAVFALAGFNLVFVLEEIVYDIHVRLHPRKRRWQALPSAIVLVIAVGLPVWSRHGGPSLPAFWITSLVAASFLLGWWFIALVNGLSGRIVLRELHLLVIGALLASLAADGIALLDRLPSVLPSLLAYLILLGTWVYVSYTTLQRTHFLLRGDDAAPWVAILLGASLAIVAHAQILFQAQGTRAVTDLADTRLNYLAAGLWLGISFFVLRSAVRILGHVRDTRGLSARGRNVAAQAARVAGTLEETERVLQDAAGRVLRGIDQVLPGEKAPAKKPTGWELDGGRLRRL